MKKQKVSFQLKKAAWENQPKITAKREVPYAIRLASQLVLDELSFNWNKRNLERQINHAIDQNDREQFKELSQRYQPYTYE